MLVLAATRALGGAGGKEFARRIAELAGLVNSQQKLLRAIQRDVTALVEGPQKTALTLIADAALAQSEELHRKLLERARDALTVAANQETDSLRRSYAWLLSAAVWQATEPAEEENRQTTSAQRAQSCRSRSR